MFCWPRSGSGGGGAAEALDELADHERRATNVQIERTHAGPARRTELGPAAGVISAESQDLRFANEELRAKMAQLQAANAALQVIVRLARGTERDHAAATAIQVHAPDRARVRRSIRARAAVMLICLHNSHAGY